MLDLGLMLMTAAGVGGMMPTSLLSEGLLNI